MNAKVLSRLTVIWLALCAAHMLGKIVMHWRGWEGLTDLLLSWPLESFGQYASGVFAVPAFLWVIAAYLEQQKVVELARSDLRLRALPKLRATMSQPALLSRFRFAIDVANVGDSDIRNVVFAVQRVDGQGDKWETELQRFRPGSHQLVELPEDQYMLGLLKIAFTVADGSRDEYEYFYSPQMPIGTELPPRNLNIT